MLNQAIKINSNNHMQPRVAFVKESKHLENYLEDMIDRHEFVWEKAIIIGQKLKAF